MPVYIRKNVSYTPPSLDKIPQEAEDDFVNDPELLKDNLPQPYRMIDKTLHRLFDETWEVIAEREEQRLAEARKVRPPQYESSVELDAVIPATQYPEKQVMLVKPLNSKYANCTNMGFYSFVVIVFAFDLEDQGFESQLEHNQGVSLGKRHLLQCMTKFIQQLMLTTDKLWALYIKVIGFFRDGVSRIVHIS